MHPTYRPVLIALTLTVLAPAAFAGNPFYLVGKLGDTSLDVDFGRSFQQIIDGNDNSWSVGVGFKLGKYFAFQGEYYDFGAASGSGSPCDDSTDGCIESQVPLEADSTAVSVTVLPQLPLSERFSLYGKLGFVSWESDVSEIQDAGDRFIDDFDDEDIVFGGGLRYQLPGPLSVFGEYERISDTFETFSLGATLGF